MPTILLGGVPGSCRPTDVNNPTSMKRTTPKSTD